jgi:hypothetical protein
MKLIRCILPVLLALALIWPVSAADLKKDMSYREVKTWHEQFLAGKPTTAERLNAMRQIIRTSRIGERGLQRAFRNFEGAGAIDPTIPGVEQTVLLQRTSSGAQARGYRRELLYATAFHHDPRFTVVEMNRQQRRPWGNTDADLIIRDNVTGLHARVEVKDVSLNSQSANLRKYKLQIDKMVREARVTGQKPVWINSRAVHPQISEYATRRGVVTLGNVKTGGSSSGKVMLVGEAKDRIAREVFKSSKARAIGGGAGVAFGALMLLDSSREAMNSLQEVWDPNTRSGTAMRLFGQRGTNVVAGGSMTLSASALLASQYAPEPLQYRLFTAYRYGTWLSIAALAASEAFLLSRRMKGDISARDYWITQCKLGAAGVGGVAGSAVGGTIGAVAGPVPSGVGAVAGAMGGGYAGDQAGAYCENVYSRRFKGLDQEFGKAVYARYGLT